jgi:hypothetical protein
MTSAPLCVLHMIGSRPATTVETVITFGRSRSSAPSMTAARRVGAAERACRRVRASRSTASSRYTTITTAVCTAVPKSAMKADPDRDRKVVAGEPER